MADFLLVRDIEEISHRLGGGRCRYALVYDDGLENPRPQVMIEVEGDCGHTRIPSRSSPKRSDGFVIGKSTSHRYLARADVRVGAPLVSGRLLFGRGQQHFSTAYRHLEVAVRRQENTTKCSLIQEARRHGQVSRFWEALYLAELRARTASQNRRDRHFRRSDVLNLPGSIPTKEVSLRNFLHAASTLSNSILSFIVALHIENRMSPPFPSMAECVSASQVYAQSRRYIYEVIHGAIPLHPMRLRKDINWWTTYLDTALLGEDGQEDRRRVWKRPLDWRPPSIPVDCADLGETIA